MVTRIFNTSKWTMLPAGKGLDFEGDHARVIEIEVNCPAHARLDAVDGKNITFLWAGQGYQKIQFRASERTVLGITSEDDIWYYTVDGDQYAVDKPQAVSFVDIEAVLGREKRNPQQDYILWQMQRNAREREEALLAEYDAMAAERDAANAARAEAEAKAAEAAAAVAAAQQGTA